MIEESCDIDKKWRFVVAKRLEGWGHKLAPFIATSLGDADGVVTQGNFVLEHERGEVG